jgi:hypothetical protein
MRLAVIAAALVLLFGVPAAAQYNQAKNEPRECRIITKQIERYGKDIERAQDRGNELWERSLEDQIVRLASRRAERCPGYPDPLATQKFYAKVIDLAAKAAWKYFTWEY